MFRRQKGYCPSTDISALRGYGGAGGRGTDPTRLSQPFPAPQRQGRSVSNAEGHFTLCYKNTWGWELSEHFLCFLHRPLEWKWLEVSPQALFFFLCLFGMISGKNEFLAFAFSLPSSCCLTLFASVMKMGCETLQAKSSRAAFGNM